VKNLRFAGREVIQRLLMCITLLFCLSAGHAAAQDLTHGVPSFQGGLALNWPDTDGNKSLRSFLEDHDGRVVFLELEIDVSVSVESQVQTMKDCGLDVMSGDFDGRDLLNRELGFPEAIESGRATCWTWLTIESEPKSLPRNGASVGIVWFNLDGFFFVRNAVHGNNPPSFFLREIEADALTWARMTQEH
jgi:hypothetical protein